MTNDEELERSDAPVLDIDAWEEDEALRSRRRDFPVYFETVVDTIDGPQISSLDLRDLSTEELNELVPVNKFAYLELMHREIANLD